jgi:hypothetical protein
MDSNSKTSHEEDSELVSIRAVYDNLSIEELRHIEPLVKALLNKHIVNLGPGSAMEILGKVGMYLARHPEIKR